MRIGLPARDVVVTRFGNMLAFACKNGSQDAHNAFDRLLVCSFLVLVGSFSSNEGNQHVALVCFRVHVEQEGISLLLSSSRAIAKRFRSLLPKALRKGKYDLQQPESCLVLKTKFR